MRPRPAARRGAVIVFPATTYRGRSFIAGKMRASRLPIATASQGQTIAYTRTITQPVAKLTSGGKVDSV